MSQTNDGGPVIAVVRSALTGAMRDVDTGMSLRDYFAAAVLPTLAVGMYSGKATLTAKECEDKLAVAAYAIADAMLAERQAKP